MKLSSRVKSSAASSSGKASLSSSWVDDDLSASASSNGQSRRRGASFPAGPKDAALRASIRHHNLMAVATALGQQAMVVGNDGTPLIEDRQVLALWSTLQTRSHLGYAEIVESLIDVARQCLVHGCTPRELAKHLKHAPVNAVVPLHP